MEKSREVTASDVALIIGLLFFIFGFMFLLLGSIIPPFSGIGTWSILILVLGIAMLIGSVIMKAKEKPLPPSPSVPSSSVITKEKETIVKEVVMIPCPYCGGLMPQTSTFCPHCSAKRKA